jgi:hypothetical protein
MMDLDHGPTREERSVMPTIPIYQSTDEVIPTHTEDYYEEIASQEEVYLEEREEELRAILTSTTQFHHQTAAAD